MGHTRTPLTNRFQPLRPALLLASMATAALVAGCSDSLPSMPKIGDLNPFAEKQKPLPGTRLA